MTRLLLATTLALLLGEMASASPPPLLSPPYRWTVSPPLLGPAARPEDPCHALKDPTLVFHQGKWHLFATIRSKKRTHQIEYISFKSWENLAHPSRQVLSLTDGYFCAPQVFFYTPHKKWYLLYQVIDPQRKPQLQPAYSTTTTLADPTSWSKPKLLFEHPPEGVKTWIDFWIICDDSHAHLFFTSLDGKMWRAATKHAAFPTGWSRPRVVLSADIFEASHTYKLKGHSLYLTLVEAQAGSRRYYKAYTANRLDGTWKPLADSWETPFAGLNNLLPTNKPLWTSNISHGELLRSGIDERLEVDPEQPRFLFQGVSDENRKGKSYGDIPWKLGLLSLSKDKTAPANSPPRRTP